MVGMSREPSRVNNGTRPAQDLVGLLLVVAALLTFFALGKTSAPYFAMVFIGAGIALIYLRRDGAPRTSELPFASEQATFASASRSVSPAPQVATSIRSAPATQ